MSELNCKAILYASPIAGDLVEGIGQVWLAGSGFRIGIIDDRHRGDNLTPRVERVVVSKKG